MSLKKILFVALLALAAWAGIALWKGAPPFAGPEEPAVQAEAQSAIKPMPEKPPFLFSRRSLSRLCDDYGLDKAATLQGLERLGINAESEWSIKRIAEENDMESHSVFDTIRQLQE